MNESTFPLFNDIFPPGPERIPFNPSKHEVFAEKVPLALANEWRNIGFGAYGKGLLWNPEPDKPFLNPDDWPTLDGTGIEVVRTAFASVCLWQKGKFIWLNVHTGKTTSLFPNTEVLFDSFLIEKNFRKNVLFERLYRQARKQHGDLNPDECFGFAPLPAFGGDTALEYIVKVMMRDYVAMAAQALGS